MNRPVASSRAQANLPAFAIAVLVVTTTASLSLLVVDGAFVAADREPVERTRAASLAAGMVDADSPLTARPNVLNGSRTTALDDDLESWFPATAGVDVRVILGESVLVERGDPTGGTTVRRLVLVADATPRSIDPVLDGTDPAITLPRRAPVATVTIDPPLGSTVSTVRVNDRVVLHDPDGLDGEYDVELSRFETATLRFDTTDPLPVGSVTVSYRPAATRKAVLAVTVDV